MAEKYFKLGGPELRRLRVVYHVVCFYEYLIKYRPEYKCEPMTDIKYILENKEKVKYILDKEITDKDMTYDFQYYIILDEKENDLVKKFSQNGIHINIKPFESSLLWATLNIQEVHSNWDYIYDKAFLNVWIYHGHLKMGEEIEFSDFDNGWAGPNWQMWYKIEHSDRIKKGRDLQLMLEDYDVKLHEMMRDLIRFEISQIR
jgi:hypothetical protein